MRILLLKIQFGAIWDSVLGGLSFAGHCHMYGINNLGQTVFEY